MGGKRSFAVAEAIVLEARFGARFVATAAGAACPELLPKRRFDGRISDMAKQAKAIRVPRTAQTSLRKLLE